MSEPAMADYYSLLSQLLEGLPNASAEIRQGIYDRARRALSEQLKAVEPALTPAELDREKRSLEDAIARLERALPIPVRSDEVTRLPQVEEFAAEQEPEPDHEPYHDRAESLGGPATIPIRRGGRRQRPSTLLLLLVLLAIPVAVLAFLWRDRPSPPPVPDVVEAPAVPVVPANDLKYSERVGGTQAPARSPAQTPPVAAPAADAPSPPQTAPARQPAPAAELSISQRALFFEENPADPQNPTMSTGRAIWRLDGVNAGQGQPLETVIRGVVEVPSAGLALSILIRRNLDTALPASHTIELGFATVPTGVVPARTVRDVALPMMRPEETIRGVAVAGLPVPVKENLFLIGLSDLKGDVDRNAELLLKRNWMELPIRFASGQKAVLLFDKGVSGERVFLDAFRQWGQTPP